MRGLSSSALVAAALFASCGRTPPEPESIAALGDSITQGYGARYAYPELLRIWRPVAVHNLGTRGDTTADMLLRLPAVFATGPLPQTVVVMGGTNDIGRGWPMETSVRNLRQITRTLRETGREPLVVLPTPAGKLPREPLLALCRGLRASARRDGVPFVDPWPAMEDPRRPGSLQSDLTDDQLHPNERGQYVLARQIARRLGWSAPPP
jgi:lysophospholipase L1-like esterase